MSSLGPDRKSRTVLFALAALVLLVVWSWLPQFLTINPGISYGDEGVVAQAAKRVVSGQLPFRDFTTMFPPGTAWWYGLFLAILGNTFFALRMGVLVTAVLLMVIACRVLSRLAPGQVPAYLVLLSYLAFFGGPYWFIASHHWVSLVLCLLSLALLLPDRGEALPSHGRVFLAGIAATGVALTLQHKGGLWLVAVSVVIVMQPWRQAKVLLGWFWGGVLALAVPVATFLLVQVGWQPLLDQLLLEPLAGYHQVVGHRGGTIVKDLLVNWKNVSVALPSAGGGFAGWLAYLTWNLGFLGRFLAHLFPALGALGLAWLWRAHALPKWPLLLLTAFFFTNYLATLHRFHETTLVFAAPATVLVLALVVAEGARRRNRFFAKVFPAGWSALFLAIALGFALLELLPGKRAVKLPVGTVYGMFPAEAAELSGLDSFFQQYRRPDDKVLCLSYVPMLYYLLDFDNPTPYEVISPISGNKVFNEVQGILEKQRVRWIIRDHVAFSGLWFGRYLSSNYQVRAQIGKLTIYERISSPGGQE